MSIREVSNIEYSGRFDDKDEKPIASVRIVNGREVTFEMTALSVVGSRDQVGEFMHKLALLLEQMQEKI